MFSAVSDRTLWFYSDESGAAMVEYSVALMVVLAIGITIMTAIGGNSAAVTQSTCGQLANAVATPATC